MAKRVLFRVVPSCSSFFHETVLCEGTLAKCRRYIEKAARHTDPVTLRIEMCTNPDALWWGRRWEPVPEPLQRED
ncbi:MAG: hypothetical protein PWQ39_382 [Thermacetogenium sp.]|nr:hypothetical protein [Thermacetogenium sp.]